MQRPHFISRDGLQARIEKPGGGRNLSVLCNFMAMPGDKTDGYEKYLAVRIPGAVYFDIDKIADTTSPLPHMIASPEQFSEQMSQLGIGSEDEIVVYDRPGLFSSARVWWNLRVMGARDIRILEGGFERWQAEGRPVESGPVHPPKPGNFVAIFDGERVVNVEQMLELVKQKRGTILDARSRARFSAEAKEPRAGLKSGHMPGAISLPFTELVENGTLINNKRLQDILNPILSGDTPIVTTCGSGVTAAVLSLAMISAGIGNHALFDGSWTQWGDPDHDYPIAKGA